MCVCVFIVLVMRFCSFIGVFWKVMGICVLRVSVLVVVWGIFFVCFLLSTVPSGGDPNCYSLSFSMALSFFPQLKYHIHLCILGRRL